MISTSIVSRSVVRPQVTRRWISYYKLFPRTFPSSKPVWEVDQGKLRKEYRSLQAQFHPDKLRDAPGDSQELEERSALLNKAFHTLKAPLTRSQYLLKQLQGVDLQDDKVKQQLTASDPELLMEVLDVHEQLSECESEEDVRVIEQENKLRLREIESQLDAAYESNDLEAATVLTVSLKYWTNLALAIKEWAPGKPVELVH